MPGNNFSYCIPSTLENASKLTEEIVADMRGLVFISAQTDKNKILQDIQLLVYELLANEVGHADGQTVCLSINVDDEKIVVETAGSGKGFPVTVINSWNKGIDHPEGTFFPPYPETLIGKEISFYRDFDFSIDCSVISKTIVRLKLSDLAEKSLEIEKVNEHFGLFLIVTLSDIVEYIYNENGTGIFKITKYFKTGDKKI
jgi:anti-sigma regulatory factor (Ser/Thr protein kinase)